MRARNMVLDFQTRMLSIRNKIEKMSSSDRELSQYFSKLDEIMKFVNDHNSSFVGNSEVLTDVNLDKIYFNGLKMLDELESKIDIYAKFHDIYLDGQSLKKKLVNEITSEDLEKCISELLVSLEKIKGIKIKDYDSIVYAIDDIYAIILYVMKIEILRNGKSILFDKLKLNQNDRIMISNLIKKELDEVGFSQNNNFFADILENMGVNKANFDLFDERLIFLLAMMNNSELDCNLEQKLECLKEELAKKNFDKKELSSNVDNLKLEMSNCKKHKRSKLFDGHLHVFYSLLLVGAITLGGFGMFKLARKNTSTVSRNTTIVCYDSINGEYTTQSGIYTERKKGDICLQEISGLRNSGNRLVTTYWIRHKGNKDIDSLEEYLENTRLFYECYDEFEFNYLANWEYEFLSNDSYMVVGEVTDIDRSDKIVTSYGNFGLTLIYVYVLYVMILFLIYVLFFVFDIDLIDDVFAFNSFSYAKSLQKEIDRIYPMLKESAKALKITEEEMMQIEKMYQDINTKYGELMKMFEKRDGKVRKLSM